jgi:hypothetical protein
MKSSLIRENVSMRTSGRSKRNIPLPIFKNEPMGRNNEYTYESTVLDDAEGR